RTAPSALPRNARGVGGRWRAASDVLWPDQLRAIADQRPQRRQDHGRRDDQSEERIDERIPGCERQQDRDGGGERDEGVTEVVHVRETNRGALAGGLTQH